MIEKFRKQIVFTNKQIDVVESLIGKLPGINTFSDAVRYAVMAMENENSLAQNQIMIKKINYMSKDISILLEMLAGSLEKIGIESILPKEETAIYKDTLEAVNNNIQIATTVNSVSRISTPKKRNFY